jgi:SAM-dependent methyltransferase
LAAARVGPAGFVLATDIAPNLVAFASQTAREKGLKNLDARVMDAENLTVDDEAFDVIICRLGLFFLPDLPRALSEIRRALKPGGRVGGIVFSTPDKNPFLSVPISITGMSALCQKRTNAPQQRGDIAPRCRFCPLMTQSGQTPDRNPAVQQPLPWRAILYMSRRASTGFRTFQVFPKDLPGRSVAR